MPVNSVALSQIIETLHFFKLNTLAKNLVETGGFSIGDIILADKKGLAIRFSEPSAWKLKSKFPDISYGKLRKWGYSINSFAKLIHEDSYWWSYPDINEIVQGGWTVAEIIECKAYPLKEIINAFKYDNESFQKKDIKMMVSNYEEKTVKNTLGLTNIQFEYLKNIDEDDLDSLNPNEVQLLGNDIDTDSNEYLLSNKFESKKSTNSKSSQYPPVECKPCVIL